jgi:hypothetical protein
MHPAQIVCKEVLLARPMFNFLSCAFRMTDDLAKEMGQGAADIVFDAIALGPGVSGLIVASEEDNGIPWGGVGIFCWSTIMFHLGGIA